MKILHIGYRHTPFDTRIFYKECVSLGKYYKYVTYITSNKEKEVGSVYCQNVNICTLHTKGRNKVISYINYLRSVLKEEKKMDADVIHVHETLLLPIARILKQKNKIVIYDCHEDNVTSIKANYGKKYSKLIGFIISEVFKLYETWVAKKVDIVIVTAKIVSDRFEKYGIKTEIIRNYPIINEVGNIEKKKHNGFNVTYIGALTEARGVTNLVKIIENLDACLLLAGNYSPASYSNEVKSFIGYKKTKDYGYVNRDTIKEILSITDVGMATVLSVGQYNVVDALGIKVYEYMAAGIPVIISDYPYAREILEKEKCAMFVDPSNINQIQKAIEYLRNNQRESIEMGCNGKRAVFERYNWKNEEEKLFAIYKSIEEVIK